MLKIFDLLFKRMAAQTGGIITTDTGKMCIVGGSENENKHERIQNKSSNNKNCDKENIR